MAVTTVALAGGGLASLFSLTVLSQMALWLEVPLLLSMLGLCTASRWVRGWSRAAQYAVAAIWPALAFVAWTFLMWPLLGVAPLLPGVLAGPSVQQWVPIAIAAALGGAFALHYLRLRQKAFVPASREARLQVLQARIRPHFLFNSLNAVLSLMRSDPRRAEATIEDLADVYRALTRDPSEVVSLEQELELCRRYLAIESVRLRERLTVHWDVAPNLGEQASLPRLLLQPLVENAILHGIEPSTQPGTLWISAQRRSSELVVSIRNTLPAEPIMRSVGRGMALQNIRERLSLVYDLAGSLQAGLVNGQFLVVLSIPLQVPKESDHDDA